MALWAPAFPAAATVVVNWEVMRVIMAGTTKKLSVLFVCGHVRIRGTVQYSARVGDGGGEGGASRVIAIASGFRVICILWHLIAYAAVAITLIFILRHAPRGHVIMRLVGRSVCTRISPSKYVLNMVLSRRVWQARSMGR